MIKKFFKDVLVYNKLSRDRYMKLYKIISDVEEAIQYAWDQWDDDITNTYYTGVKPKFPTDDFTLQWIGNEDFEADGYDVEYIEDLLKIVGYGILR